MANGVIIQFFQWYNPADGSLWDELKGKAKELADAGFTAVWIPPSYKGQGGGFDVGYGVYDLFDLGEFDQKGSLRTKYGTKSLLLEAIKTLQLNGMQVYADVVFNHKDGGDAIEEVWAQEVDWNDRNRPMSEWYKIQCYTGFNFLGRGDTYSSMKWHWWCFDALTYNDLTKSNDKLYRLQNKTFSTEVSHEHGNYDYLMANDLDIGNEFVRGELFYWGRWFVDTTQVDGFRIDAVKHIRSSFFKDWLNHLRVHFSGRELFSMGEYWSSNVDDIHWYISASEGRLSLFDVPLHQKLSSASKSGSSFDMRTIFDRTLVKEQPALAVTFVENHDTQPLQSLESVVESWFKPMAYALILLRRDGYPCVFYADYYGAHYEDKGYEIWLTDHSFLINKFLFARKAYGYGDQHDYFDHPNTIGWMRLGNQEHPGAMAVVLTNSAAGNKWMNTFRPNTKFYDSTGHIKELVQTNSQGWGNFLCNGGSVSVWLQQ
ncbi:MAG: alpha-amylase [Pseudanabaena frigida]|uniref:Alpha-amylase n=1 Tax=Pseudanabaena frigida TaxID=945775 RepID=A0A2W4WBT5_9CYAN|nr:MAG: alpha-amylase [Pseudanabaena frigida]